MVEVLGEDVVEGMSCTAVTIPPATMRTNTKINCLFIQDLLGSTY